MLSDFLGLFHPKNQDEGDVDSDADRFGDQADDDAPFRHPSCDVFRFGGWPGELNGDVRPNKEESKEDSQYNS